ncbi:hypothetical protein ZHAS_00018633 [Anopheles sinensis]|uniref:Uncharacterized protein n=1 Tax=Anopheles sinensis TaxID=74873 RepID=A0A084WJG7_ANOSI|nr:hypothetical protein ZHAS_00018633 [Anopheles sinensis]
MPPDAFADICSRYQHPLAPDRSIVVRLLMRNISTEPGSSSYRPEALKVE